MPWWPIPIAIDCGVTRALPTGGEPWKGETSSIQRRTDSTKPREKLKQEIKRRFGFEGRLETRVGDALLLQVKLPNVPGLKPSKPENGGGGKVGGSGFSMRNQTIADLARNLQNFFDQPIFDRTGLTGNYDISLRWPRTNDDAARSDAIRSALLQQLGLELVPGREQMEMLVVEKVR